MAAKTLIVSDCSKTARDLWHALRASHVPVSLHTPHTMMADWWPVDSAPDVLLVNAALDVALIRRMVERIEDNTDRPPAVMSFAANDCDGLTSHIEEGHDYIVPPFVPNLVRARVAISRRHRDLGLAVRQERAFARRREYERELLIGREIQRGFLPESLPTVEGWDIAAYFEPAREVSGDFYDAYDVINGDFLGFAIADVCDKGIGAALFMALIRSLLRQAAVADAPQRGPDDADSSDPATSANLALRAVRTTNDYLTTNHLHQAYFATLFFGIVDPKTGELVYINCGHNPPIIRRANGEQQELLPTGPALALIHDAQFELGRETLHTGDLLLLYTDGVPESKNTVGEFFGEERLRATMAESGSAATMVERFRRAVLAHSGTAEQFDDVTILGLHRQPAA